MPEQRQFNRTVAQINPLLDKIANDYSKDEIDDLIAGMSTDAITLKGTATKYANLPSDASEGDAYKVAFSDEYYADGSVYTYHNGVWVSLAKNSYLKAEIDNIDRAELAKIIDGGAKNLLNVTKASIKAINTIGSWNGDVYTRNDNGNSMTFTLNSDMSITVNGTAANRIQFNLKNSGLQGFQGCILSGGGTASILFQMSESPYTTIANDTGSGTEIGNYDDSKSYSLSINISAGVTVNNLTIKPMICAKSAWVLSTKYVPYCPTLAEIYAMVQS
jgi:hypothetical protein